MTTPLGLMSFAEVNAPPTADQWNDQELDVAGVMGLPTTSWQAGATERTIFAVVANMMAQADVGGSIAIQAGFLTFAAFGSVTYTDASGAVQTFFVTPDPSISSQNPTGALGWLDVLADGLYNVQRILLSPAGGTLAILNTQATTYGPFDSGNYHVAQPGVTGAPTYANTSSLSIPQSATAGAGVSAVTAASPIQVTDNGHSLSTGAIVFITGVGGVTQANGAFAITKVDANNFTLNGTTGTGSYTSGGTVYTPTVAAFTADVPGTASNALGSNLVNHPVTSLIGVSVANVGAWLGSNTESNANLVTRCRAKLQSVTPNGPKGAYLFYALSSIQLAPTLNPPKAVSSAITRALVTSTSGAVKVTIANAAGAVSNGSDITATDAVIQAFAVPVSVTETTQSAVAHSITVLATIYVPAASASAVGPVAQLALITYFQVLAIGGVVDPGGATNVVPIEGVRGAIEDACAAALIPVQDMTLTLNGTTSNVTLALSPTPEVAVFANSGTFVAGQDLTVVGV